MTARTTALLLAVSGLFAGCNPEFGLTSNPVGRIAVAAGDFDDIADPLDRVPVHYAQYEGIISTPTWDPEWDHTSVALSVEELLSANADIYKHDTVFVASGVRGLGLREYNGLDPDDHLVNDPAVIENVRGFVEGGRRTLFLTDWAYDLVEAAWPDAVEFMYNDALFDDAQCGEIGDVTADVVHEDLAEIMGSETMGLTYNYSNWAVIEAVGEDTTVWVAGDAEYRLQTSEGEGGTAIANDVPMLISFEPAGGLGRVVYASFHVDAQSAGAIDTVLTNVVGDFEEAESATEQVE